jgi:RND family efflux transporter MFP subunit
MSPRSQAVVSLVLILAVAGGWYVYRNPQVIGFAGESPRNAENAGVEAGEPGGRRGGEQAGGSRDNRIPGLIGGGGAVNVVTAPVEMDRSGQHVMALGTAKAARSVVLYPQVSGIVADIAFKPGQTVAEGAELLRLDDDEEQATADRARIEYAQARATFERSQSLAKSKTISNVALGDAEMAAQLAENQVRLAEIAAGRRVVKAPFAGIVGLSDISIGDLISNSTAIATLDDLTTVRVGFEVPERWSARIVEGQAIAASAPALPGSKFSGKITGIDSRVDETTRTLKLEAELANPDQVLKAGMAITVELEFDMEDQLAVPSLAVQWDRRGSYVWKVVDGAVRRAEVAIVRRESGIVVVAGDVKAGDKVVVEGLLRLREGAKVNEVDETPTIVDQAPPAAEGTPAARTAPPAEGAGSEPSTRG